MLLTKLSGVYCHSSSVPHLVLFISMLGCRKHFVRKLTMNFGSLRSLLPCLPQLLHLGALSVFSPVWNRNGDPQRLSNSHPALPFPHAWLQSIWMPLQFRMGDDLGFWLKGERQKSVWTSLCPCFQFMLKAEKTHFKLSMMFSYSSTFLPPPLSCSLQSHHHVKMQH